MCKITALVVTLAVFPQVLAGDELPTLLVRLEERTFRSDLDFRTEILVYRDGAVQTRQEVSGGGPPMVRLLRQSASDAQMRALGLALLNNQVGHQHGGCFLVSGDAQEPLVQTQVDWFGKGPRRNSFVTDTRFTNECGPEVYAIIDAIEDTFGHSSVIDDKHFDDLIEKIK
jgi:hypothetical protein